MSRSTIAAVHYRTRWTDFFLSPAAVFRGKLDHDTKGHTVGRTALDEMFPTVPPARDKRIGTLLASCGIPRL